MKKRKKFDDGGSVMDKPNQDMRDPAYRKSLEREQALESSSPEMMLVGPVRGVGSLRGVASNILKGKKPPTGAVPEIGSKTKEAYIKREFDALKAKYPDIAEDEVQRYAKYYGKHEYRKTAPVFSKKEKLKKDIKRAEDKIGRQTAFNAAVPGRREEKEDKPDYETGRMKKGGSVSSAFKRADGVAQRGKTKGRMV